MLCRSFALHLAFIALAAVVFFAGCSGPDAPPKKGGGTGTGGGSGKSMTTAAP